MSFNVRLVDDEQPNFIAEFKPVRVVGIVRSAYGVEVQGLDQQRILSHRLEGDRPTRLGRKLVSVNASDDDRGVVDLERVLTAANVNLAHRNATRLHMQHVAVVGRRLVAGVQGDYERVQVRGFRCPQGWIGDAVSSVIKEELVSKIFYYDFHLPESKTTAFSAGTGTSKSAASEFSAASALLREAKQYFRWSVPDTADVINNTLRPEEEEEEEDASLMSIRSARTPSCIPPIPYKLPTPAPSSITDTDTDALWAVVPPIQYPQHIYYIHTTTLQVLDMIWKLYRNDW